MDVEVEMTLKALRSRNIEAVFAKNVEQANKKILGLIPKDAVVVRNGSATVTQIGILEELRKRGTTVLKHGDGTGDRTTITDVFLTSTNAITQDGRLVDVDGHGSRIAGTVWGHRETMIVVGKNKIVKDLDEAFYRVRNLIAPYHVRLRALELGGLRRHTPCVITGKCVHCMVEDRSCNIFAIIEGKPTGTSFTVVIINEDLGLAWDESWPQERINKIIDNYKKSFAS